MAMRVAVLMGMGIDMNMMGVVMMRMIMTRVPVMRMAGRPGRQFCAGRQCGEALGGRNGGGSRHAIVIV